MLILKSISVLKYFAIIIANIDVAFKSSSIIFFNFTSNLLLFFKTSFISTPITNAYKAFNSSLLKSSNKYA